MFDADGQQAIALVTACYHCTMVVPLLRLAQTHTTQGVEYTCMGGTRCIYTHLAVMYISTLGNDSKNWGLYR